MYFDRLDICAAYYIFCVLHHTGQTSWGYKKLSQLTRMKYKPGLSVENLRFENRNQLEIYKRLKHATRRNSSR